MKQHAHKNLVLAGWLFLVLCGLIGGCGGCQGKVDPGSDPVVVNAERSREIAFETINSFIEFDHANRELLKLKAPEVHAFAESLREKDQTGTRRYERIDNDARAAIQSYKAVRSTESADKLDATLRTIEAVASEVRRRMIDGQRVVSP